ncbi:hypothetical protein QBC35DRAFT_476160 [Podospora australis]|uniref:Uncharacterized protein n=1 Tax=Podospora australis TaxID=1536484 RepID=A0AAN7AH25_9PEZI|nr:hypothetical protein QBC35DRAFT_476160 [Podospora australis]
MAHQGNNGGPPHYEPPPLYSLFDPLGSAPPVQNNNQAPSANNDINTSSSRVSRPYTGTPTSVNDEDAERISLYYTHEHRLESPHVRFLMSDDAGVYTFKEQRTAELRIISISGDGLDWMRQSLFWDPNDVVARGDVETNTQEDWVPRRYRYSRTWQICDSGKSWIGQVRICSDCRRTLSSFRLDIALSRNNLEYAQAWDSRGDVRYFWYRNSSNRLCVLELGLLEGWWPWPRTAEDLALELEMAEDLALETAEQEQVEAAWGERIREGIEESVRMVGARVADEWEAEKKAADCVIM